MHEQIPPTQQQTERRAQQGEWRLGESQYRQPGAANQRRVLDPGKVHVSAADQAIVDAEEGGNARHDE